MEYWALMLQLPHVQENLLSGKARRKGVIYHMGRKGLRGGVRLQVHAELLSLLFSNHDPFDD